MNNSHSKWFTNKRFVIISFLVALAISVLSAVAFNVKPNRATVSAVQIEQNTTVSENKPYKVVFDYNFDDSSVAKPLASGLGTTYVWTSNGTTSLTGGTTIRVSSSDIEDGTTVTVTYTPDGGAEGTLGVITPENGYYVESVTVKGSVSKTATASQGISVTTEELDPNYGGTITITAECKAIEYILNLPYSVDNNKTFIKNDSGTCLTYKIDATTTISKDNQKPNSTNLTGVENLFAGWILINFEDSFDRILDETNKTIKITDKKGTKTPGAWTLSYDKRISNEYTANTGDYIYYLTGISGWGNLGECLYSASDTDNSRNPAPVIRARWAVNYKVKIINNAQGWVRNLHSDTTAISDETLQTLAGVAVSTDGSTYTYDSTGEIYIQDGNHTFNFMASEDDNGGYSFYKNSEIISKAQSDKNGTTKYAVYNYGYRITAWQIKYVNQGTPYYFTYNGTTWNVSTTEADNAITSIKNKQNHMSDIAAKLDEIFAKGLNTADAENLTLTFIPKWEKVKIDVVDDRKTEADPSDDQDLSFMYEDSYDISGFTSTIPVGKSRFCFRIATEGEVENEDATIISPWGDWNYKDISYSNYKYDKESGVYTLNVTPLALDDIFKVVLKEKDGSKPDISKLDTTKTDYVDDINSSPITLDAYTALGIGGFGVAHIQYLKANENLVYIEDYTKIIREELVNYYPEFIDNDGTNDGEMFRKIFVDNNGDYCIFLANNQPTARLPVFAKTNYTLISWDTWNTATIAEGSYVYKTIQYEASFKEDYGDTTNLVNSIVLDSDGYTLSDENSLWQYDADQRTIYARYYRKNYKLEINHLLAGVDGKYGYTKIEVVDGGSTKNYIAIYNDGDTKIYDTNSLAGVKPENLATDFRINAGSVLTFEVFDQSKDHSLKDFIGHKYSSIVSFHTPVSTEGGRVPEHAILDADATLDGEKVSAILYSNYIATIYGETLETLSYQSGDTITIDVNFEYIKYTVNPTLTDTASGYFSVSTNPGTDHSKILKDLTIDTTGNQNSHKIDYYAYAGYEFDTEAFKIKATYNALTKEQTLSEYNPTTLTLSVGEAQAYTLTLDADWLIDNFYSLVCNNYDVEATDLGIISINTKKIDFTFGYKLFDGTTTSNKGIIGEITRTLEDNENNIGETIEGLVSSQLTTSADKGDIIRYADVDYALLTSMLYCENIDPYNTDLQNNLARYPFKLDKSKIANDKLLLTSSAISFMTGAEDGIILPLAKRALYVLLDVRPILELKVTLVDDSNFTDNPMISARVSNECYKEGATSAPETKNVVSVIRNAENSGKTKDIIIYTYKVIDGEGASKNPNNFYNTISTSFNTKRYIAVEFYESYTSGKFENRFEGKITQFNIEENTQLYIRYVAKTIDAEIEYYFDDVKVESFDAVSSMFEDYSIPSTLTGLSCNDADSELTLSYTVAKSVKNYAVQFAINGNDITTTDIASNKTYEISHVPNEADFDYGKIVFSVKLQKFDSSKVQIKYALESGYREDYDKYGDFKILIDGEEFEHSATTVADGNIIEIELYENNDLELDLSPLAKGYEYTGTVIHNSTIRTDYYTVTDNVISLITDYNPGSDLEIKDAGMYQIIIKKSAVTAKLNYGGSYLSSADKVDVYKMEAGGNSTNSIDSDGNSNIITGLKIGDTISFVDKAVSTERVKAYYYIDKSNNKVWLTTTVEGTEVPSRSVKITTDLLNNISGYDLRFGFEVIKKFKADINIESASWKYVDTVAYAYGAQTYTSGTYLDKGSVVNIKLTTKDSGHYDVYINNVLIGDSLDYNVTLNNDVSVTIKITPKKYDLTVNKYLFTSLPNLENNLPSFVVDGSSTQNDYSSYLSTATVSVVVKNSSAQLESIEISGNEKAFNITISYNGNVLTATWNDGTDHSTTNMADLEALGYSVKLQTSGENANLIISYSVVNDITLTTTFIEFKEISQIK